MFSLLFSFVFQVKLLLDSGARVYLVNKAGKSAFDNAKNAGWMKDYANHFMSFLNLTCSLQFVSAVKLSLAEADPFSDCRMSPSEITKLRNSGYPPLISPDYKAH
jgi:hypothetical protein